MLEPLERAIAELLIPSITERNYSLAERELLELPVRMGGLGFTNPVQSASSKYEVSVNITAPLLNQIVAQTHEPADEEEVYGLQRRMRKVKDEGVREKHEKFTFRKDAKSCGASQRKRLVQLVDSYPS